ncbi:hypothetical protein AWB75_01645 [Caballeronia catudaia]|uniref:Uncharacterized protein n=1 Tax=Caballeronia catudaia TaxID=1777136 RepID=A0A158A2T6_9BURK|nr:hypothetical protein [Caballeronia catudaia]SAK52108.1 hypothetical protein AWB75_01645 [Caballeronia catudaia]
MLNFVLGFFREYWPVVLACAIAKFVIPPAVDWFWTRVEEASPDEAEQRPGAE